MDLAVSSGGSKFKYDLWVNLSQNKVGHKEIMFLSIGFAISYISTEERRLGEFNVHERKKKQEKAENNLIGR